MTSPAPAAPAKPRRRIPKTVWDLVFTLLIPILILTPNVLGSGITVAEDVFGGGTAGNVRAYITSALIPVGYVAWDLLVNRNLSPVALFGGAGALVSGALVFWFVDGFWFAVKDSARSYLTGILFLISAFTSIPLFRVFIDAASIGEKPEDQAATRQAMRDPAIHRALAQGTVIMAVIDLIGGVVNSAVNYREVVARFGTEDFNAQVAKVNAIMRVPSLLIGLAGVAAALWVIQRAVKARYGAGVSLFEPAKLAAVMRERGELPTRADPAT